MRPTTAILAALLLVLGTGTHSVAAKICVDPSGAGGCYVSATEAIAAAPSVATIDVAAGVYSTTAEIGTGRTLAIRGAGADATVLAAHGVTYDILRVSGPRTRLHLSDLTVSGGLFALMISHGAQVTLERVRFTDSLVALTIEQGATARILASRFEHNDSGIECSDGALDIARTTFIENDDAVHAGSCRLSLTDSRLVRNRNDGLSGGGAPFTIRRSTIARNGAIGIRYETRPFAISRAELTIIDSTISGNGKAPVASYPGGIRVDGARLVQIVRSTISGNANTQGDFAAALWASEAAVVMRASTVSGNEGNGVLFVVGAGPDEARLDVEGSTIAGNTGAGLSCLYGACGPVATTILDGNGQDCAGTVRSGGFNLVASPVGCTLLPGRNADLVGLDARLAPLGDNGGFTRTHALLPGSPATAAITDGNWCTRADQRGVRRRRPCDVGAYEAP